MFSAQESAQPPQATTGPTRSGWTLTWSDEFDGPAVDTRKWDVLTRRDNHNQELQSYVPEQAKIVNGVLVITATDEPHAGKKYRSARLESHFTQAHGRFEARVKMPVGQGMWPAFWLLPRPADWPRRGEIDIVEYKGSDAFWMCSTYHFADPKTGKHKYVGQDFRPKDANGQPIDLSKDFHTYAVEWEPGVLRFYFDDAPEPHYTMTRGDAPISDEPMCVILNLAVGGWFGGNPDATTKFPQTLEVDWVRVWKRSDVP
jgi:beta-glucanase (GH16 family)